MKWYIPIKPKTKQGFKKWFSYVKEDDKKAKKAVLQDCGSLCAVDCRSHSSDSRAL